MNPEFWNSEKMLKKLSPLEQAMKKEGLVHHGYYSSETEAQRIAKPFEKAGYRVVVTYHELRAINAEYGFKPYQLLYGRH